MKGLRHLVTLALFASAGPVAAQTPQAPAQVALPLNRFTPSFAGDRFFGTGSPYVAGHLDLHAQVLADYCHDPFVVRRTVGEETEEVGSVVEHQLSLHVGTTLSLLRRLALDVSFPAALYQAGDDPTDGRTRFVSPSGAATGDLRLGARLSLTGAPDDFFQLGMGALVWIPTSPGEPGSYLGDGTLRAKPQLLASGVALRFVWGLEAGIEFRETHRVLGVGQGSMLSLKLANGVLLGSEDQVQLSLELAAALVPIDISPSTTNFEALAGGKWRFVDDFVVGAGVGPGLFSGIGTPDVRAVLSIAYTPLQDMGVMRSIRSPD